MSLKVKDVADLLNVSETTIRRWVAEGKIPNYRINQQCFFSRTEIENWVITHKLDKTVEGISPFTRNKQAEAISLDTQPRLSGGSKQYSLFRAIHKGDVLHNVNGNNKEEVIRETMKKMAKGLNLDAEVITELLLDRENLMPTALNNGFAVPHTRDTLLSGHHDSVIVVFLERPLEYGALDGQPVGILFFLFACEDKRHLHLLAKIAHLSSQLQSRQFLQSLPSKKELLSFIKEWEGSISGC